MTDIIKITERKFKTKDPDYHKKYYASHKDTVGVYTVPKYAKNKYRVTNDECSIYGDEICNYGKYMKLKKHLQSKFPDMEF